MAKTDRFTTQQVIDALTASRGMKTIAARRLGCVYNTIQRYIDTYPTVKAALKETRESMGDSIESTLLATALGERNNNGGWKTEPNVSALIFLAKTHPAMRERGYGELHNVNVSGELAITKGYKQISPDDWDDDGSSTE